MSPPISKTLEQKSKPSQTLCRNTPTSGSPAPFCALDRQHKRYARHSKNARLASEFSANKTSTNRTSATGKKSLTTKRGIVRCGKHPQPIALPTARASKTSSAASRTPSSVSKTGIVLSATIETTRRSISLRSRTQERFAPHSLSPCNCRLGMLSLASSIPCRSRALTASDILGKMRKKQNLLLSCVASMFGRDRQSQTKLD